MVILKSFKSVVVVMLFPILILIMGICKNSGNLEKNSDGYHLVMARENA